MKALIKKLTPGVILGSYHFTLSLLGAFIYGFPSRKLKVIGVTGTSGKSTVVELTSLILKEAGLKTASISSIRFTLNEKTCENRLKMTMPGRMKIQSFLKRALKEGCEYVVMEVTSEGIKQHRHRFISFNAAVFTNLSLEHIESHKGFENYKKAKLKLFKHCQNIHIINSDSHYAKDFLEVPAKKKILFGIKDVSLVPQDFNLVGKFNLYNAICAIKIVTTQGVSLDTCQKALRKVEAMPGRMEVVSRNPLVIVDYAHTPTQLKKVYQSIEGEKVCVLGSCGGGRDKWKRKVMGEIAQKHCKKVIITNEDPYDEDPLEIIDQVAGNTSAEKILDRKEAIKKAVSLAKDEAVIITGKGSEPWMCAKDGKKVPWDDRQIAREALENNSNLS